MSATADTFAATLAALRTARGWSQNRLAHLAGYDHRYVTRLEAGKRDPSRETVTALAGVLALDDDDAARLLVTAGFWPGDDAARRLLDRMEG